MTATEKLISNIFEQNYIENPSKYKYENRVEPLVYFVSGIAYDLYENRSKEEQERDDKEEIELIDYIYIGLNTIHDMISKTI